MIFSASLQKLRQCHHFCKVCEERVTYWDSNSNDTGKGKVFRWQDVLHRGR